MQPVIELIKFLLVQPVTLTILQSDDDEEHDDGDKPMTEMETDQEHDESTTMSDQC